MRMSKFLVIIALVSVFAAACSVHKSQFSRVPDLGDVYFSDQHNWQHFYLGGGTNCLIQFSTDDVGPILPDLGFTNSHGPFLFILFEATNVDKTVIRDDYGWVPFKFGQKTVYRAGDFYVQFAVRNRP